MTIRSRLIISAIAFAVLAANSPLLSRVPGYEQYCAASPTDHCIGVSGSGDVFSYWDEKVIGKAQRVRVKPYGIVKFGNYLYCAISGKNTRDYRVCKSTGWAIER